MTGLDPPPATCIDELQRQRMLGAEERNGQDKAFPCREPTYKFILKQSQRYHQPKEYPQQKTLQGNLTMGILSV